MWEFRATIAGNLAKTTVFKSKTLQESMNRPVSGSDFGYDIPLKETQYLQTITDSQEIVQELQDVQKQYSEDHTEG